MLLPAAVSILLATSLTYASAVTPVKRDNPTPVTTCTTGIVTPRPPNTQCGFQGVLKKPAPIQSMSFKGSRTPFLECRDYCLAHKHCISFSFNETNEKCVLYSKHLASMNEKKSQNSVVHYNHNCFTSSCTTSTPTPTNTHCGGPSPAPTFYLQAVAANTPLDNMYAGLSPNFRETNGYDFIALSSNADDASIFTFSDTCDLQGTGPSGGTYDDAVYDSSPSSSGQNFAASSGVFGQNSAFEAISCRTDMGVLSCTDPYNSGMQFFYCPAVTNEDAGLHLAPTTSNSIDGQPCYSVTFTTLANNPAIT